MDRLDIQLCQCKTHSCLKRGVRVYCFSNSCFTHVTSEQSAFPLDHMGFQSLWEDAKAFALFINMYQTGIFTFSGLLDIISCNKLVNLTVELYTFLTG